ncbi:nucleoside hydrolase [Streptomyces sp. NPDC056683]|uniref:nucleoside hydrolase n=1 Tax=Streptomyces sp. NPDC056683 TaxID=3345910 RepID=UPI00367F7FF1
MACHHSPFRSVITVAIHGRLTHRAWVSDDWLKRLAASGPAGASLVSVCAPYRAHYQQELGVDGLVLHDAVAVAEAIWPGTLKCRRLAVDVVCDSTPARGATLIDTRSGYDDARVGREIDVALDADIDALRPLCQPWVRRPASSG